MSAGGIAAIIAASGLLIFSLALAYAVIRLGRAIDEVGAAVKNISNETTPLISEVTTTVELVNGPLQSINKVTRTIDEVSTKVAESTSSFLDKNQVAMKAAGAVLTAAQLRKKSKGKKRQTKRASKNRQDFDDEEF
jgi:uncharacterized protein YoxC